MGSCGSSVSDVYFIKPKWTDAVQVKSEYLTDTLSDFSSGFHAINDNTIELTGTGNNKFDGARWSRGFTSGKHVIEIIYPVHLRGSATRIGLGTTKTSLGGRKEKDLVGGKGSWAIDLTRRKAFHDEHNRGTFPSENEHSTKELPDWFFMYIDLDLGTLQFGSDSEFYGTAFMDVLVGDEPLYPIVTASKTGAIISMVYRGQGKEITGPLRKKRKLTRRGRKK